jgi:hypothetical protein
MALAALALVVGLLRSETRYRHLAIFVCASLLALVGFLNGRMNAARLQLAAQPFYVILTGAGFAWVVATLFKRPPWRIVGTGICVLLVGLSLWFWPGPLPRRFAPQDVRSVFREGVVHVPDNCTLLWPMKQGKKDVALPAYLLDRDRGHRAVMVTDSRRLQAYRRRPCLVFFRAPVCYDIGASQEQYGDRVLADGRTPVCEAVERPFVLRPLYVRDILARPDGTQRFSRPRLPIGFFRIVRFR